MTAKEYLYEMHVMKSKECLAEKYQHKAEEMMEPSSISCVVSRIPCHIVNYVKRSIFELTASLLFECDGAEDDRLSGTYNQCGFSDIRYNLQCG